MNIFRVAADQLWLSSKIYLLHYVCKTDTYQYISLKSQILYLLIFLSRYADLFWNFWGLYNSVMKVLFISLTIAIVATIKCKASVKDTYESANDGFWISLVIIPSFIAALFFNVTFTPFEIAWAFSRYLEIFAIIPQCYLIRNYLHSKCRYANFDNNLKKMIKYILLLTSYRFCYIINWIYRYMTEDNYYDPIAWIAGAVQLVLYFDVIYHSFKNNCCQKNKQKIQDSNIKYSIITNMNDEV